jgi:hypothetical protein
VGENLALLFPCCMILDTSLKKQFASASSSYIKWEIRNPLSQGYFEGNIVKCLEKYLE